jgi:uncharacterized protein (TIGR00369 family)
MGAWTLETVRRMVPGTMLETIGLVPVEVERGRFVGAIEHRPGLAIRSGVFHAGALITLADTSATVAALTVTDPDDSQAPERFPLAVSLSASLVRNAGSGRVTAEAVVVHAGRRTQVVETRVRDGDGRLLATVTTTHLVVDRGGGGP